MESSPKKTKNSDFLDGIIRDLLASIDKSNFNGKEKILFYKELVYMLKGGVSLVDTMDTLYHSSENQAIKMVAKQLEYYVRQGKPLSYGISRLPEYFDEGDAAIIKTGETSGNLPTVLSSLAEEYAYIDEIKQKYIGAMIYPCSLIVISVAAVIYLFASVLPGIFGTIMSANVEPPTVTKILKDISDFFVNYWKIML